MNHENRCSTAACDQPPGRRDERGAFPARFGHSNVQLDPAFSISGWRALDKLNR